MTAPKRIVLLEGTAKSLTGPGLVLVFEGTDGKSYRVECQPLPCDELMTLTKRGRLVFEVTE